MPQLSDLAGLWRRSLIAWPDGRRDMSSKVRWLQGFSAYADLRQPASLADLANAPGLSDLSRADCERLAEQQGFAGHLTFAGHYFEWQRSIDFQPSGTFPDVGSLRWEQDTLIEEGRDVPYIEHWHREGKTVAPIAAATLQDAHSGRNAIIVRVGEHCMFARERAQQLPTRGTLRECLAEADGIGQVRALIDCEISLACVTTGGFRIAASTLPFRVGQMLRIDTRLEWRMMKSEGDTALLTL